MVAIALAHIATLMRGHGVLIIRALVLIGFSSILSVLFIRNGGVGDLPGRMNLAVGFLVPAIVGATASFGGPILYSEAAAAWIFRSSGTSRQMRLAGGVLAAALLAGVLGSLHGTIVLVLVRVLIRVKVFAFADAAWMDAAQLVISCVLTAVSLSAVSLTIVRSTRTSGHMAFLQIGLTVAATLMNLAVSPWSLLMLGPAAVVASMMRRQKTTPIAPPPTGTPRSTMVTEQVMLEVLGVTKALGGRKILKDVAFACRPSEVVMVVGHNGAGKSTLLRILAGIVEPDRGEVLVDGASMAKGGVHARRSLGYAPDATEAFPQLMVSEFVGLIRVLKGLPTRLDGAKLRSQLGVDPIWYQRLDTLSLGQLKRVFIFSAALGTPKVLILDEPSDGLDLPGTEVVLSLLKLRSTEGLTTICATNDPAFMDALPATRLRVADGRVAVES